jgi:hypothetical protein
MKVADFDQPAALLATDSMSVDDAQVDLGNECSTRCKTALKHDTKSKNVQAWQDECTPGSLATS